MKLEKIDDLDFMKDMDGIHVFLVECVNDRFVGEVMRSNVDTLSVEETVRLFLDVLDGVLDDTRLSGYTKNAFRVSAIRQFSKELYDKFFEEIKDGD